MTNDSNSRERVADSDDRFEVVVIRVCEFTSNNPIIFKHAML